MIGLAVLSVTVAGSLAMWSYHPFGQTICRVNRLTQRVEFLDAGESRWVRQPSSHSRAPAVHRGTDEPEASPAPAGVSRGKGPVGDVVSLGPTADSLKIELGDEWRVRVGEKLAIASTSSSSSIPR